MTPPATRPTVRVHDRSRRPAPVPADDVGDVAELVGHLVEMAACAQRYTRLAVSMPAGKNYPRRRPRPPRLSILVVSGLVYSCGVHRDNRQNCYDGKA